MADPREQLRKDANIVTPGTVLSGRYELVRELGRGGMATVYLAQDIKHRRDVAVKILSSELSASLAHDRFLREIEIAARLNHPHIVALFDSGADGDVLYYVMPCITGESLRALLSRERILSVPAALRLTHEIASALGYAHQSGIVHRDIKPENVLLSDGIAVVADFGISRAIDASMTEGASSITQSGLVVGTPHYMSPEQATADIVDGRSDLYSLACVLFEMLAGRPPFTAANPVALIASHVTASPPDITGFNATVPAGVADAILRGLAKTPDDRYQTAVAFVEALSAATTFRAVAPARATSILKAPNNLPIPRTTFIGRNRETTECTKLLEATRLLTLTGIGGCGKTRLALNIAQASMDTFPDGVYFVDLAPVAVNAGVQPAIASVVGVAESPDTSLTRLVAEHLGDKRVLLLLDNCEHLLSGSAEAVDALLSSTTNLRVLATSREGLGLEGERLVAVRSLGLPPRDRQINVEELDDFEAVRLFADRAELAASGFALTRENASSVVEICRRLDGIPLAIELAAARTKLLSVEDIRARLDDRFRLLTGSSRSVLPRHQTLSATIQWSYDQLSENERPLFRALSCFAGGWTLESAGRLFGEADEFLTLESLGHLADKSLISVQRGENTGATRYGMLETVRQFGWDRLAEAREAEDARGRHLDWFAELAESAYAGRIEHEESWARRLEDEHDNLRLALETARSASAEKYLELAGALAWYWHSRSHLREGREHLRAALDSAAVHPSPPRARALWGLGLVAAWQGDGSASLRYMEDALAMWRTAGNQQEIGLALEGIGWAKVLAGDDEGAERVLLDCLSIQEERGNPVLINRAKVALAQVWVALSKVGGARKFAQQIIEFAAIHPDVRNEHFGWHFLADCALIEGDCEASLPLYQKSLQLARAMGDRIEISFEIQGVAMSLAGLGNHAESLRLFSATTAELERMGADIHIRFWDALLERFIGRARAELASQSAAYVAEGRAISFDDAATRALEFQVRGPNTRG